MDATTRVPSAAAAVARAESAAARGGRPWWIWLVPSVTLFAVLVARNTYLFSTRLYEQGDSAADSVLIQQALRLRLLTGHYSREGFFHPGPVYLYILAFGQWLAHDVLHIVPTPWNGQFLAVFALTAAFTALAVAIVYGWTRSLAGAAATFAVIAALISTHTLVALSGWPPNMFVLTYLVFMLSAASVAARQSRDLWILALSGWMLIHGYAPFLFFVPLIVATAAAIALARDARHPVAAVRAFCSGHRRAWLPAAVISAVFLLPIALNLILHWPGQFGRYIDYSKSGQAGGHTTAQVLHFVKWFWGPGPHTTDMLLACAVVAPIVTLTLTRGLPRRCFGALLIMAAVTTLAFGLYALTAADVLTNYYIGYFYWSVPFSMLLIVLAGVAEAIRFRVVTALALGTAVAMVGVLSFEIVLRADAHDDDLLIPPAVAAVASRSHGRMLVLDVQGSAWPQALGFLLQAERTDVPFCVVDPVDVYRVITEQFACTSQDEAEGARYTITGTNPLPAGSIALVGNTLTGDAAVLTG